MTEIGEYLFPLVSALLHHAGMLTRPAVFREVGAPLSIEAISLDPAGPTEVQVKVKALGLCRTDLHVMRLALFISIACSMVTCQVAP